MVTLISVIITALLVRMVWRWCKENPSDVGFSD